MGSQAGVARAANTMMANNATLIVVTEAYPRVKKTMAAERQDDRQRERPQAECPAHSRRATRTAAQSHQPALIVKFGQEDGVIMPQDREDRRKDMHPVRLRADRLCQPDRARALQDVEHSGEDSSPKTSRPHGVRPARASAGDIADILPGGQFHDQQAEGNRANQVGKDEYTEILSALGSQSNSMMG